MIRRPPRSTLFPYTTPLPISRRTPPARERAAAPTAPERLPPGGDQGRPQLRGDRRPQRDRKSTRLNSSHGYISYAVFCLKKKNLLPQKEGLRAVAVHAARQPQ